MPNFQFFLSGGDKPIAENDPILGQKLPVSREGSCDANRKAITFGEYFEVVHSFLSENRMERLRSSIFKQSGKTISSDCIDLVSVHLEKHGEFYHPSKVDVRSQSDLWRFVVNVAVSNAGLKCAEKEFEILKQLKTASGENFIPRVYEQGLWQSPNRTQVALFSGEWFSGFHEFHVSAEDSAGKGRICVWDPETKGLFLTEKQAFEVYRAAAFILAYYFNLESFEQIYPWSHAAGDFVLSLDDGKMRLKLITVRGYRPLFQNDEYDLASVLSALAAFLADLSIKNRLDRVDGVGEICWADDFSVPATIEGFFGGIGKKAASFSDFDNIPGYLALYLASMSESDIMELFDSIVGTFPAQAPETHAARENIRAHASLFFRSVRKFILSNAENFA